MRDMPKRMKIKERVMHEISRLSGSYASIDEVAAATYDGGSFDHHLEGARAAFCELLKDGDVAWHAEHTEHKTIWDMT